MRALHLTSVRVPRALIASNSKTKTSDHLKIKRSILCNTTRVLFTPPVVATRLDDRGEGQAYTNTIVLLQTDNNELPYLTPNSS